MSASRRWYRKAHWQILLGLIAGAVYGVIALRAGMQDFTATWIAPWGVIFLNLLKLIAMPLVVVSVMSAVSSLGGMRALTRVGSATVGWFLLTTMVAGLIGLVGADLVHPGRYVSTQLRSSLEAAFRTAVAATSGKGIGQHGPLEFLVALVPENLVNAAADNRNLLQLLIVSLLAGVGLLRVPRDVAAPIRALLRGAFDLIVQVVHIIMIVAPLGVFGLVAGTMVEVASNAPGSLLSLASALGVYALVLVGGLVLQTVGVYSLLLFWFSDVPLKKFYRAMAPAQLVAFSTSSSAAALPVTLEVCRERLGISDEVSSFVVPLGTTVNMDGTAMFLVVAALFIAQATGTAVPLPEQITVLGMAALGSVAAVAVPSIGIVFLISILAAIGAPTGAVALALSVDRPLDMLRTVTNVTGDAVTASIVDGYQRRGQPATSLQGEIGSLPPSVEPPPPTEVSAG